MLDLLDSPGDTWGCLSEETEVAAAVGAIDVADEGGK